MKVSNQIRLAVRLCLRHQVPFVAYADPSEKKLHFRSSLGQSWRQGDEYFFIGKFAASTDSLIRIPFIADAEMTVEALEDTPTGLCNVSEPPMPVTTDMATYLEKVEMLIEELRRRGGKTVISRVICGSDPGVEWIDFAKAYFEALPMTYRFLYYTPDTGAWIVATPELLFHYNRISSTAFSMALAGTRRHTDIPSAWDAKNQCEHEIVSTFIADKLEMCGISPEVSGPVSLSFGEIEHLCTTFMSHGTKLTDEQVFAAIDALNPTPALAGYPLEKSLEDISRIESHDRGCYGGIIGLCTDTDILAVVNLRSLRFRGSEYCIFAGGGIMPDSIPENEWDETTAKSAVARSLLSKMSISDEK